ncbi:CLUMA_CG012355, isoform A [Clunio marinus]|uniref:CLUMA_CG012355, isoform A n=1 Tax=Clunio marinus TaxID=568069 RepID=A0A1J1IF77_9DIPT|nr:CLUMA_CG012355, isoform A [Clunio marinus]
MKIVQFGRLFMQVVAVIEMDKKSKQSEKEPPSKQLKPLKTTKIFIHFRCVTEAAWTSLWLFLSLNQNSDRDEAIIN